MMLTDEQRKALEVAADTLTERFAAPIRALLSASKPAAKPLEIFPDDDMGRRGFVTGWNAALKEVAAAPAQSGEPVAFDECPASGQSCNYAPEGRHGEMQCRYCGAPQPSQPVEAGEHVAKAVQQLKFAVEKLDAAAAHLKLGWTGALDDAHTFVETAIQTLESAPSAVVLDDERAAIALTDKQILNICKMYEVFGDLDIEFIYLGHAIIMANDRARKSCADAQSAEQTAQSDFKNFHRLLCDRFGYVHDEQDWQRDQLSLIEWIAARAASPQPQAQTERVLTEPAYSWLPISSAPRDGSNILIRFGRDGVSQAKYVPGVPHPWKFIDTNDGVTWLINGARDGEYGPSHWMPMPSPHEPEPGDVTAAHPESGADHD